MYYTCMTNPLAWPGHIKHCIREGTVDICHDHIKSTDRSEGWVYAKGLAVNAVASCKACDALKLQYPALTV